MIKYVLFDLDGTLTESATGIFNSIKYALGRLGVTEYDDKVLKKFVGPPLLQSFKEHFRFDDQKAWQAVNIYREYFSERGLFENAVYEGIPEALEKLKSEGFSLAVATSKPQAFCNRILDHFDLKKYFDAVTGVPMDDMEMTKAQVIASALEKLGVTEKTQAIMVGDRFYDMKGAAENGIDCIGVLYGYGSEEELLEAGVVAVVGSPLELIKTIVNR